VTMIGWQGSDDEQSRTNINALSGIRTHNFSVQDIKASDHMATGNGYSSIESRFFRYRSQRQLIRSPKLVCVSPQWLIFSFNVLQRVQFVDFLAHFGSFRDDR
jgi:hypothetical protein